MDRVVYSDHRSRSRRDDTARTERLRHRRAAEERCVRAGLLRLCTPVPRLGEAVRETKGARRDA